MRSCRSAAARRPFASAADEAVEPRTNALATKSPKTNAARLPLRRPPILSRKRARLNGCSRGATAAHIGAAASPTWSSWIDVWNRSSGPGVGAARMPPDHCFECTGLTPSRDLPGARHSSGQLKPRLDTGLFRRPRTPHWYRPDVPAVRPRLERLAALSKAPPRRHDHSRSGRSRAEDEICTAEELEVVRSGARYRCPNERAAPRRSTAVS